MVVVRVIPPWGGRPRRGPLSCGPDEQDGETGKLVPRVPRDDGRTGAPPTRSTSSSPRASRRTCPSCSMRTSRSTPDGRARRREEADNEARLTGLRALAVDAVRHLVTAAEHGEVELSGLPAVFAATNGDPDDPLAGEFRKELLAELDLVPSVRSREVFATSPPLGTCLWTTARGYRTPACRAPGRLHLATCRTGLSAR